MGTISLRSRYSIINPFRVTMELVEFDFMFTIEKPKQIHIQSWKNIIEQSLPSHNFQYENINFDMFWSNIFQDDFFAFAAKNEDKFMGIIVAKINETYYQKIIDKIQ